jgi:hypothetical protein
MMESERVDEGNAFPTSWESAGLGPREAREVAKPGKSLRFGNHKD